MRRLFYETGYLAPPHFDLWPSVQSLWKAITHPSRPFLCRMWSGGESVKDMLHRYTSFGMASLFFFASHQTGVPETKGQADLLWDARREEPKDH
jgi:hypothetical protein